MWTLWIGLASAEDSRWLADAYVELPWALTVPGRVRASEGTADAFRVLLELECETEALTMVCDIEDAAFQARATRPSVGIIGDELVDIRDSIIGGTVTLEFKEGGRIAVTPDLDGDELTQQQRALTEQLMARALMGFDGVTVGAPALPTWIQDESVLTQIPGTYASGVLAVRHTVDGEVVHSEGEGSTRTPGGTGFLLQMGAEGRLVEGQLQDRWWWVAGNPMVSNATNNRYIQGGVLRRIGPGEHPLVGIGSGELPMSGPSIDAAVIGAGAYDGERDYDLGEGENAHYTWVRAGPNYRRRDNHQDVLGAEVLLGYGHPTGMRLGVGYATHLLRSHDELGRDWPVRAHDLLFGLWFRPPDEPVAPHLGAYWGPSVRDYVLTTPRTVWIPTAGGEVGIDFSVGPVSLGAFARVNIDGATTLVTHGATDRVLRSLEFSAGVQASWGVFEW